MNHPRSAFGASPSRGRRLRTGRAGSAAAAWWRPLPCLALALLTGTAHAQFDPARMLREPPGVEIVAPGTLYLPLDQPLAPVIAAAMEPDSQSSYAANRLLDLENSGLRRVISRPAPQLLERR